MFKISTLHCSMATHAWYRGRVSLFAADTQTGILRPCTSEISPSGATLHCVNTQYPAPLTNSASSVLASAEETNPLISVHTAPWAPPIRFSAACLYVGVAPLSLLKQSPSLHPCWLPKGLLLYFCLSAMDHHRLQHSSSFGNGDLTISALEVVAACLFIAPQSLRDATVDNDASLRCQNETGAVQGGTSMTQIVSVDPKTQVSKLNSATWMQWHCSYRQTVDALRQMKKADLYGVSDTFFNPDLEEGEVLQTVYGVTCDKLHQGSEKKKCYSRSIADVDAIPF